MSAQGRVLASAGRLSAPLPALTAMAGAIAGAAVALVAPGAREVLLVLALGAAAGIDLRTRRVPNWLVAGAGAFALTSAGGEMTSALAAGALAASVGVLLVVLSRGGYGMGDAKAMGVAGATVGLGGVLPFLLAMSLAGGVLVVAGALAGLGVRGRAIAYAPAIAAGCLGALLLA